MNKFCTNCKYFTADERERCLECNAMDKWEPRFAPQKVYITTARGGGKSFFTEELRKYLEEHGISAKALLNSVYGKNGPCGHFDTDNVKEKTNMYNLVKRLATNNHVDIVVDGYSYPVTIDTLDHEFGEPVKFSGHMATPAAKYVSYEVAMARMAAEQRIEELRNRPRVPEIKKVHCSGPVTAVVWADGTVTRVRCTNEEIDYEKGLAMAIAKKVLGTNKSGSDYYDVFRKFLPKPEVDE